MPEHRRPNGSQIRDISQRASRATVGTHTQAGLENWSRNAARYGGNASKARRGQANARHAAVRHGEINQLHPETSTRESRRRYNSRVNQRDYATKAAERHHNRKLIFIILGIALTLALAIGVGVTVYTNSVNQKLAVGDANLADTLADSVAEDGSYYILMAVDTQAPDTYVMDEAADGYVDTLVLARISTADQTYSALTIPGNLRVTFDDGEYHRIGDALADSDSELVEMVEAYCGVDIAHYIKLNGDGFINLVDQMGGLTIDVPEEADDPNAGYLYIPAGEQTLDGKQALYLCRAANYSTGDVRRCENVSTIMTALLQRMSIMGAGSLTTAMDSLAEDFSCDLDLDALAELFTDANTAFNGNVYTSALPTYTYEKDDVTYQILDDSADVDAIMAQMGASLDPGETDDAEASVDKSSFDIQVLNGGEITGAASQAAAILEDAGFTFGGDVGNTEQAVYDETLIVYQDESLEDAANLVCSTLGQGRVVYDVAYYSFDTDILVVIGNDWLVTE